MKDCGNLLGACRSLYSACIQRACWKDDFLSSMEYHDACDTLSKALDSCDENYEFHSMLQGYANNAEKILNGTYHDIGLLFQ